MVRNPKSSESVLRLLLDRRENSLNQKEPPAKNRRGMRSHNPMTELTAVETKGGCKTSAFITKI